MADKTFKRERNRPAQRAGTGSAPPPDAARRRALLIVIAGLMLGAGIIALTSGYRRDLTTWAQANPAGALNLILPAIAVTVVLPVLGLAFYFWRLGARAVREQRFPPAHATWAVAAAPMVGAAARRRGRVLQGCAAALAVIVVVFSVILIRLVLNLKSAVDSRAPF